MRAWKGQIAEPALQSAEVSAAQAMHVGAASKETRLNDDGMQSGHGHGGGSSRDAQDPTFDAIFDDILAS